MEIMEKDDFVSTFLTENLLFDDVLADEQTKVRFWRNGQITITQWDGATENEFVYLMKDDVEILLKLIQKAEKMRNSQ